MSEDKKFGHNSKKDFLKNPVQHIDITSFDSQKIIASMEKCLLFQERPLMPLKYIIK